MIDSMDIVQPNVLKEESCGAMKGYSLLKNMLLEKHTAKDSMYSGE